MFKFKMIPLLGEAYFVVLNLPEILSFQYILLMQVYPFLQQLYFTAAEFDVPVSKILPARRTNLFKDTHDLAATLSGMVLYLFTLIIYGKVNY